ncbi:hypothetical protein U14_02618 [Candidatus Moduliflexus flocculans]|uniref:Uncharacterized protein n=1 Tax=Candidatus Moduliflexus flocculans TaxID=1499966 RepID=A0A081BLV9_9BACT|nr:hypothetical protein U14_02618 [Candidatus Moduliflexus flocculans]
MPYYLALKAVNFDYSVYDTHDISTIRGGSFAILQAFRHLNKDSLRAQLQTAEYAAHAFVEVDVLSTASSEALLCISSEDAEAAQAIKSVCLKLLRGKIGEFATVVAALTREDGLDFPTLLQRLEAECRWQQYQSLSFVPPYPEHPSPNMAKNLACEVDGVRPAVVKDGGKSVSRIVKIRRDNGRPLRNQIYNEILERNDAFSTEQAADQPDDVTFTSDLNRLADDPAQGRANGKIAYIYLDGNRFGTIKKQVCVTPQALKDFQTYVQKELREPALKAILKEALATPAFRAQNGEIRMETLMWGGDEMEWIVPAWQAFALLRAFFETAAKKQRYTSETHTAPVFLTHAGGVVFCRANLPILQVRRYARSLCEFAKTALKNRIKARDPQGIFRIEHLDDSANVVAALDMTAFDLVKGDIESFIAAYHQPASPREFVLTASELLALEEPLQKVKASFPRTKLFDVLDALRNAEQPDVRIEEILKRVKTLLPKQTQDILTQALETILQGNPHRWFVIADLLDYVGDTI